MAAVRFVFTALLALACAHAHVDVEPQDIRIIGGDDVDIAQFPYQVALFYFDEFRCGGSILNENFILTAAHCLHDVKFDWHVSIRAGSTKRSFGGQYIRASKIAMGEGFTMKKLHNDVGIVKLETPLNFTDLVRPVELVDVGSEPQPGSTITLSGWGVTNENSNVAPEGLRTTTVKAVNRLVCSVPYFLINRITKDMFCAAALGKDTCQGDSGGPAVNGEGKQVGIVSFGMGCANVLFPGVYTNLASKGIRDFIDKSLQTM
ncbi:trypsin alpha-3-like [Thrips palmi]|uniref:Trypsin alpha-3-like n=1 Tax=Thrips palmi TaxID=161013 RepID=A0A6P8YLD8_THRPL|nr:trypsin alpha-3-like [Thrips palmi]